MSGELEEWLGCALAPTLLFEHPTIDALSTALAEPPRKAAPKPAPKPAPSPAAPVAGDSICVVGISCRFPGGSDTPDRFWENLLAGFDGGKDVPADRWDASCWYDPDRTAPGTSYTTRGGFVDDLAGFDAGLFGIAPGEALRMDPQQRLLLELAWSALEDAGIAPDRVRGSRTGVFVGMMTSPEYGWLQTDRDGAACIDDPYFGIGTAPSVAAGRLSYALDLRGPSLCVDTACSSSLLGVHLAAESLRRGESDLALAGGVSALVHPVGMVQACRTHQLAADGRCKTFDDRADGFLMAEGCGFVVLERRSDAAARGHRVLAVIRGSAVNQDGRSNGLTAPSLSAQVAVIRAALAAAGAQPADVGYVEAHGSGTRLGDAIEMSALQEVFGAGREREHPLVVGAVKTNVGHLLGAAGVAGLVKTVQVVRHGQIPANRHLEQPSSAIDWERCPVSLPGAVTTWPGSSAAAGGPAKLRMAGVSSFGWSGTNVHVVIEQPAGDPQAVAGPPDAGVHVLPLSARTGGRCDGPRPTCTARCPCGPTWILADVARTLQGGRAALEYRRAHACRGVHDALAWLAEVRDGAADADDAARANSAVRTAFLFPGTGDQRVGMAHELYDSEPAFRSAFDDCARAALPALGTEPAVRPLRRAR